MMANLPPYSHAAVLCQQLHQWILRNQTLPLGFDQGHAR